METRIFVIYAAEDHLLFDRLSDQVKAAKLPVAFERMPQKQQWVPMWKANCRTKMFNSEGAIVLISKKSHQGGIGWELQCAREAGIPVIGVQADKYDRGTIPEGLDQCPVIDWNWPDIANFINSVKRAPKSTSA